MNKPNFLRRAYDWVIGWSNSPYGALALFLLAFAESSFFPIPPDVLLIALAIGAPRKWLKYAAVCTLGSVLGGVFGHFIGRVFFETVGLPILHFYGAMDKFEMVRGMYLRYDVWFVGVAGFTPIPYKVFTIAAGTFGMNIWSFVLASALSRGARFFLVAGLIRIFGPRITSFIDKYFNLLSILFVVIFVAGFIIIKYFL